MPAVDDLKSLDRLDQVVLGAGVLGLIFSFFPFLTVKATGVSVHANENAWHGWGLLAVLCLIVATAVAAGRLFAASSMPKLPVGFNLLTAVLSGASLLFLLIHWLSNRKSQSIGTFKATEGLAWSGWILLLLVLAQAVAAFLLFRKSGEAMPDFSGMSTNRSTAGTVPPPPPVATYPPSTNTAADLPPAAPVGDHSHDHPHDIPPAP